MAGKTGESGDICGRNLKMSTTMEIMTIESNAYRLLVEKIEKITAYVEELEKPRDFDPFGHAGFAHLWLQYD